MVTSDQARFRTAAGRASCGRGRWAAAFAALVGLVVAGCGPTEIRLEKPIDPAAERLLALGAAYSHFNFERGRPPSGPGNLGGRLSGADALVSPRDGEPFVVFWGVDLRAPPTGATGRPILAHEQKGLDGSRHVLTTLGNVILVSDEDFRALSLPPPIKPAAR